MISKRSFRVVIAKALPVNETVLVSYFLSSYIDESDNSRSLAFIYEIENTCMCELALYYKKNP